MTHSDLEAWLGRSVVRDADGSPTTVWRGEHGEHDGRDFRTRHGSLSFGGRETACVYAQNPNERGDHAWAPRVSAWHLRIERPVMNDPSDPFMDLGLLVAALGRERTIGIALQHADRIVDTGHWIEEYADLWGGDVAGLLRFRPAALDDLYVQAFVVMDDRAVCGELARLGYDGAICGGWGENALETEWRLIDPANALPAWSWRKALDERALPMAA